jgi:hypothetical protein
MFENSMAEIWEADKESRTCPTPHDINITNKQSASEIALLRDEKTPAKDGSASLAPAVRRRVIPAEKQAAKGAGAREGPHYQVLETSAGAEAAYVFI